MRDDPGGDASSQANRYNGLIEERCTGTI